MPSQSSVTPPTAASCPELLALAVHEFRTPITVVAGYLRMLLRSQSEPLSERQRHLVEEAERSCTKLAELIAQLSDLSNLDAGSSPVNRSDIPIFELVGEAAASIKEGQDRGVEVHVRGGVPGTIVEGDRVRLRAVFTSILHATAREKAGATVVFADCGIQTDRGHRWARIRVGEEASLSLVDEETGPFDEYRGGIGMVLPIARRVIEAHGGRIWSPQDDKRAATGVVLPVKR